MFLPLLLFFGSTGLCKFPQNIFIEPLRNAFLQYGQRTAFCIVFREHPPLRSTIIEEIGPVAQLEAIVNVFQRFGITAYDFFTRHIVPSQLYPLSYTTDIDFDILCRYEIQVNTITGLFGKTNIIHFTHIRHHRFNRELPDDIQHVETQKIRNKSSKVRIDRFTRNMQYIVFDRKPADNIFSSARLIVKP